MSQYKDISSYQLAIKLRTPKTILVEGATDKSVLSRYLLGNSIKDKAQNQFLIDEISIISDENLAGLGNREKLLATAEALKTNREKIKFLADREWDNIDINTINENSFCQNSDVIFLTKGHSIENYWFDADALANFLLHTHAASINEEYLEEIHVRFHQMLIFSASYSLAAKEFSCITKCGGMISADDIEWTGASYKAKDSLQQKAVQRTITDNIPEKIDSTKSQIEQIAPDLLRWICHGHLGEEAIRSCAANLAIEKGLAVVTAKAIERGHQREKLLHDASYISDFDQARIEPLGEILNWVRQ
ncbi:DUF4435 domain-containing protein [Aquipseudomonas alcaligenes]|uniref:DUF4435 domain-containing protein n=1 Tax=Aquipseudomonas alcaligenes TaxID=43263 RepID=A0A1N6QWF4_AQUAC|nr:DUF4435 domain-containing protein [Pseudomonas alcaligenes]SIQ20970.1 Protein of unknown function [Pseudomonas alcaligenes]